MGKSNNDMEQYMQDIEEIEPSASMELTTSGVSVTGMPDYMILVLVLAVIIAVVLVFKNRRK